MQPGKVAAFVRVPLSHLPLQTLAKEGALQGRRDNYTHMPPKKKKTQGRFQSTDCRLLSLSSYSEKTDTSVREFYKTEIEITPWKMRAYDFYSRVE